MKYLSNLSISKKLVIFLAVSCVAIFAMLAYTLVIYRATLVSERQHEVVQLVDTAASVFVRYEKMAADGKISTEDARERALAAVEALRYGQDGYFWVQDTDIKMVMHPIKPSLNDKELKDIKDADGLNLFVAMNDVIRENNGAGFVNYMWPMPGQDEPAPKLSYVKQIVGTNLIVGTGIYIDHINRLMMEKSVEFVLYGVAILAILLLVSRFIGKDITSAITRLVSDTDTLAEGNIEHSISASERQDEVGAMARSLMIFQQNLKNAQLREAKAIEEADRARKKALNELADSLEADVVSIIDVVAQSSYAMQETATSMTHAAGMTSEQTTIVASASTQASQNVQNVAAAAEELYNSITEISRQVSQSREVANLASVQTNAAREKVTALNEAASEISNVVKLITDIADQTNLLALNATIEAARAGDAGKGFAVVAGEVKNLANQTARATGEISEQIQRIQDETESTVQAIAEVTEVINNLDAISSSIASAVEEQGAATQEIARNVQEASDGTDEVNRSIENVATVAQESGASATTVVEASADVAAKTEELRNVVQRFLQNIRSA